MIRDTQKSLLEQMKISDAEIRHRLDLVEFSSSDAKLLSSTAPVIEEHVDDIVTRFYDNQLKISAITALIGDSGTLARLKIAQRQYILDLFSGVYDGAYVNNRLRIGLVHKRIGVEPKLYLSAVRTLEKILTATIEAHSDERDIVVIEKALEKLMYFDTTLVVDTYISSMIAEIELANSKTREYANSLEEKVAERTRELEALARRDALTGLLNQRAMYELTRRFIASTRRRKSSITIAYFDVDNFKQINDQYGHIKGDEVLKTIGQATLESVRETDIACRFGGDEFCIIFPDTDAVQAERVCKRILSLFTAAYPDITLSFGLRDFDMTDNDTGIETLINEADKLMYQSKKVEGSHIQL